MELFPEIKTIAEYQNWLPQLGHAVLILVAFWLGNILVRWILRAILSRTKVHQELITILIDNVLWVGIWIAGFVTAFRTFGVDLNSALASIGFLSVAVGFAAKDSLGNIIAGMMIFWDKPFQVGEWIEVEGQLGQVKYITVRSTRIKTLDNTYIILPNQTIINSPLINHSAHGAIRIKIPVSIGYDQSIDWARHTLLELPKDIAAISKEPEPDVVVSNLGDSGIELQLRVWLNDVSKERAIRYQLQEEIRKAFGDVDIEIPYPHRTVIMKK